jgi:beta-1,4-mannosyl-glycoprotein beta-1,4-N-acetylglucosaminyltransferase
MQIVDCFTFFNELDMLEYRFEILYDVVDYFIIVESTHTHSGHPKELFYEKNKDRFAKFSDKIIQVAVDNFEFIHPNVNIHAQDQWKNEMYQRDCIKTGIEKLCLNVEDILIVSDLDEIPDPNVLSKIKSGEIDFSKDKINVILQKLYYYNLNTYIGDWYYSKLLTYGLYKTINMKFSEIRLNQENQGVIHKCGWHLSYFGSSEFIQNKIKYFAHQEYNQEEYTDIKKIEERINSGSDIYGRMQFTFKNILLADNDYLPPRYELLNSFIISK